MRPIVIVCVVFAGCGESTTSGDAGVDASVREDAQVTPRDGGGVDALGEDAARRDAAPPADAGTPSGGFTLLTMNLQNAYVNSSTWPQRRDAIIAGITSMQPDAVCLQEAVTSGGEPNGAEQIASATGYGHVLEITHRAFLFEEGIAALSRHRITASETERLPLTDFGFAERAMLSADLDTPDGLVRIFCTHMSISTNEDDKADESVAAFRFMDARRTARAALFAGDLNAEPTTLAMRVLRGEAMHGGVTGDLVDAWTTVNPADPGYTIPSDAPDRRIDYVYVVSGTGSAGTVEECRRVFTEPVSGDTYPSDHVGVLCRIRL